MNTPRLEDSGTGRYRLSGVLSFASVPDLWASSQALFENGAPVEIDLAAVEHADSAGLALLVEWLRVARGAGRQMRFFNMPAQMLSLARVSGLEQVLPLAED